MVLIALLTIQMTAVARTETQLAGNLRSAAAAEAAADGGIYQALFHLLAPGDQRWPPEGDYRISVAGADVRVRIDNLAGRINPNVASPELLGALLGAVGLDPERARSLTDAIMDWRTPGGVARQGGAKALEYRAAGRDYGPSELPFRDIDELGAVLGMTPELLDLLRPHLTLAWEKEPIPNFADPVVTTALRTLARGNPALLRELPPIMAVNITATADGPQGSQARRHADAVVNTALPQGAWRILAWDAGGA